MGTMMTRHPYTLSVYVHALDRRRERQRLKFGYRRLFAINRSAESRGRVPDFDRYVQEREYVGLLDAMASRERASVFHLSIYQTVRARGPEPDLATLGEAVDACVEEIESASDCKVNRGEFRQEPLWVSSLPLGRDTAACCRKYATPNVGDTVPLVGTACGSPSGVPFAFTEPGRTVERLNPYDPDHANYTMLISGRSGSGKTMTANVLVARCVAHGARAFVIDRAGHYRVLTQLIEGAREISLGADDSPYAINPWDVPDPSEVPLQKVQFLLALHGLLWAATASTGAKAASSAPRSARSTPAPPTTATFPGSRCFATSCGSWRATRARPAQATPHPSCARWPIGARTSAGTAPTPTSSTARQRSRRTALSSSSTPAAAPTTSCRR